MEAAIQKLVVINLLIVALSHVLQPRIWARFFIAVRSLGDPASFILAFMSLPFGVLIVSFHNVWSGWPLAITIVGWSQVFKGTLYFLYPRSAARMLGRISVERAYEFRIAGAAMMVVVLVIAAPLARGWT